jgi:hypothetical protein
LIKRYQEWVANAIAENSIDLFKLLNDLLEIISVLNDQLHPKILDLLETTKDTTNSSLEFNISLFNINSIQERIKQDLINECCKEFDQIQAIPSQYRRTNKPKPTESSLFISNIFKPLNLPSEKLSILNRVESNFCQSIIQAVFNNYSSLVTKMLNNVTLIESSLKKFVKVKSSGESDENRIRLQCYLDFQSLKVSLHGIEGVQEFETFLDEELNKL